MDNFLLRTDSYKLTHWKQYPSNAEKVYSYLESRGHDANGADETVFFGLQYYLHRYMSGSVFTRSDIESANEFAKQHFGSDHFNYNGWMRLLEKHEGRLPLRIRAVPEGMVVPTGNVLMTIENTDPEFPWLTNYVESLLLKLWYPITVATRSREVKKIIKSYLELTGDPTLLPFKLHDFGYRGVSSEESASIGGSAHLTSFLGSDTLAGIELLQKYYNPSSFPGFSVPASEHSTMTSWGEAHEVDAMKNMLEKYPTGLVSVVSDSYDIFNACANLWGTVLKDQVLKRDGVLVIRPDSGDPTPTIMKIFSILDEKFACPRNEKGYKVLDAHVRLIQGDGVNQSSIRRILDTMKWQSWSADNIAFGMGGGLLQQVDRDTQKFAFKCSAIRRGGEWQDVFKTATGKASKRGRLWLTRDDSRKFVTINEHDLQEQSAPLVLDIDRDITGLGYLKLRFEDGAIFNAPNLDDIRVRAAI